MKLASLILLLPALAAAADPWLQRVAPIMNTSERKLYAELADDAARQGFRRGFWAGKAISEAEYLQRIEYIDAQFGADKPGSGANTDQGRIYLSLGAPASISHLPSSRVFVPCEIWYYDSLPRLGLGTQARFLFYRTEGAGPLRLYSPQLNSLRTLLIPNAGTRGLFPVNDIVRAADVPNTLNLPPAEMEVVDAATSIARGIIGSGNSEILNMAAAPAYVLRGDPKEHVHTRLLLAERPRLDTFQSWTPERLPVLDLQIHASVRARIGLAVARAGTTLDEWTTELDFDSATAVAYLHRLFLLPGDYTVVVDVDGIRTPYPLQVAAPPAHSGILLGAPEDGALSTPYRFGLARIIPSASPSAAVIQTAPGRVQWRLTRGIDVVSVATTATDAAGFAVYSLPAHRPSGPLRLQARTNGEVVDIPLPSEHADTRVVIAHNANLGPGAPLLAAGRQFLLLGNRAQARACFTKAAQESKTSATLTALGRLEALDGRLDRSRALLEQALSLNSEDPDALTAMAFVEAEFQDYAVAAAYLEHALRVRPAPALEQALSDMKGKFRAGR